jgi:hypothetical protein
MLRYNIIILYFRAICDDYFQQYDEKDRIYRFSSPKVLRLLEILRQFKPEKLPNDKQEESESNSSLEAEGTEISKRVIGNMVPAKDLHDAKVLPAKENRTVQCKNGNQNHLILNMCKSCSCEETVSRSSCDQQREPTGDMSGVPRNAESVLNDVKQSEVLHEEQGCLNGETDHQELTCNSIRVLSVDHVARKLCSNSVNEVHTAKLVPSLEKCTGCESELSDVKDTSISLACKESDSNKNCKISVIDGSFANHNGNGCDRIGSEISKENSVRSVTVTPPKNRTDVYTRNRGSRFSRRGYQKEDGSGSLRGGRNDTAGRQYRNVQQDDLDALCGIVFVEQRFTAKILYHLLNVSTGMLLRFLRFQLSRRSQHYVSLYKRMERQSRESVLVEWIIG